MEKQINEKMTEIIYKVNDISCTISIKQKR